MPLQPHPSTALEAHHHALLWLLPALEQLPRNQKFLLGDRVAQGALHMHRHLIEATFSKDRSTPLHRANQELAQIRALLRLLHELGHWDARRYEHALRLIDAVGQRVGAWAKTHAQK